MICGLQRRQTEELTFLLMWRSFTFLHIDILLP